MERFPGYDQYEIELKNALAARKAGNEGKARVCARRAAGIIVGEHFSRQGIQLTDRSAYDRIKYLLSMENITDEVRETAQHFLIRVTPEQKLPIQADLIADAKWMETTLLR